MRREWQLVALVVLLVVLAVEVVLIVSPGDGDIPRATASTVPPPAPTETPTTTTVPPSTTTSVPFANTSSPPPPGDMYSNLSPAQVEAFLTETTQRGATLSTEGLAEQGQLLCAMLGAVRDEGPLDPNNVSAVQSELEESWNLYLEVVGDLVASMGGRDQFLREMRLIGFFATKYFCPQFHPAVAAAYPAIGA